VEVELFVDGVIYVISRCCYVFDFCYNIAAIITITIVLTIHHHIIMCQGALSKPCSSSSRGSSSNSIPKNKKAETEKSSAFVYSTAAAYGNHYTTEQVRSALLDQQRHNPSFDAEFATRVLNKCGYQKHSFVLPLEDIFRRFTREEYLKLRKTHLLDLAERACVEALEMWGGHRRDITHLFWGTMTGSMDSPTIDIQLAKVCVFCLLVYDIHLIICSIRSSQAQGKRIDYISHYLYRL